MTDYGSASFDSTATNEIRSGTVVDRRSTTIGPQVRVVFPDRDGVSSDWLPVGQKGSMGTVFHFCPRVGDNVLVAHLPTGIERGMVIGCNCTPNNPAFTPRSLNAIGIQTEENAYYEIDPDASCLSINGLATIYVNASGQIQIIAGGDMDLTTQKNLNISVTGNVVATVQGSLTANVTGNATVTAANVTIQASTITLQGNTTVTGTLTVDQDVTFLAGGSILTHLTNIDGAGDGS